MYSIVIPLYNKAHTIERTLNSVLMQEFPNYEIVIVNDGSTDKGVEVIRKFTNDPRIRIEHQENQGVSAARNKGVKIAKYNYIAFLDGDDEWKPEYLSTINKAINQFPDAGMFCCAGTVTSNDLEYQRIAKKYFGKIQEIDFFENPHVFLHTSATIVSKEAFSRTNGFPIGMVRNEDYCLFFSLALLTQVVYCGIPLTKYVGNVSGQATSLPLSKVLKPLSYRFNSVYETWVQTECQNKTFEVFMKYEIRHFLLIFIKNQDFESSKVFINSISNGIWKLFFSAETTMYKQSKFNSLALMYIYITKVRWRLRGYPIIDYNVKNKI